MMSLDFHSTPASEVQVLVNPFQSSMGGWTPPPATHGVEWTPQPSASEQNKLLGHCLLFSLG